MGHCPFTAVSSSLVTYALCNGRWYPIAGWHLGRPNIRRFFYSPTTTLHLFFVPFLLAYTAARLAGFRQPLEQRRHVPLLHRIQKLLSHRPSFCNPRPRCSRSPERKAKRKHVKHLTFCDFLSRLLSSYTCSLCSLSPETNVAPDRHEHHQLHHQ